METFENALLRLNRGALVLLLAAMAIVIFANVVLRYTTSQSIEWAEEVARYLMVWLTFLGAGPVLRYGGHIAVENLQDSLPPRAALALRPQTSAAHSFLGILQSKEQDWAAAEASFHAAARLDPADATAHYNLGNVRFAQAKYELSANAYRESLRQAVIGIH